MIKISYYPACYNWAFTIVHDADDSYSLRLKPIIDCFNKYSIKSSITVFPFWDESKKNKILKDIESGEPLLPKCVPLEYEPELVFYKNITTEGHEIGLHTASDGHDKREVIERAFEFYKEKFTYYPPIYVEHRDNLQNMQFSGSDAFSDYYVVDILNKYQPWVWIVSPSAIPYEGKGEYFNVLSSQMPIFGSFSARAWGVFKEFIKTRKIDKKNGRYYELFRKGGSPFDLLAKEKYGLAKTFRRSGRQAGADGDGFVEWYCDEHIKASDETGGLAIVYTHLNTKWLEKSTLKIRKDIEDRLAKIAQSNVWLDTASNILKRFELINNIIIIEKENYVTLFNNNKEPVVDLTITIDNKKSIFINHQEYRPNDVGKVNIGDLAPLTTVILKKN